MPERPLLTADWRKLVLLNFAIPSEVIERLAPPGTEPDFHDGRTYISIVGFLFQKTRLWGLPIPGHTNFIEINLRYYVRREVDGQIRRGVVFVREVVPRRAVALLANRLYNENYITRQMRCETRMSATNLAPGDIVEYSWNTRSNRFRFSSKPVRWNRITARVAAPLTLSPPNSLEEFFVENYWGYVRGRDGRTREYRVAHNPWRIAAADNVVWDCDTASTYDSPIAEFLAAPPTSALIAEGSPVQVFRGQRV